jgi:DNA mismatch repair protein MutS2
LTFRIVQSGSAASELEWLSASPPGHSGAPFPAEPVVVGSDVLGWSAFRTLLARFTATPIGRDRALTLIPSATLACVAAALEETRDARAALVAEGVPPWDGVSDVRPALSQAAPDEAVLDGPTLAALGRTLAATERLARYGRGLATAAPRVADIARRLPPGGALGDALQRDLDPEGRLLDHASPRLRALRRHILALRADLERRLETLLASRTPGAPPSERYVTVRHGRYVVPVRAEARRSMRGIVHDRSQSGATLFVEPDEVIEPNNRLTQLALEEVDEERRLLAALSREVRARLPELEALVDAVGTLDLAFARATLAERLDASEPAVSQGGDLEIRGARHPVLVAQRWQGGPPVVPIDLRVPATRPALLITGPNAGGKTVALGTLGLLVLMAQAGCHIPAEPGSRLPVFGEVLAVIGDEQSLARDLSTFSSFVVQAQDILERATPRALVLLDELGAGTDPAEGAALGAALIATLLERGARVVATSHLEPLKVFAQTEPGCENATVAFDAERLEPAFRLEYGRPGPSHALTIAERLGLPAPVVARARAELSDTSRRLDTLLLALAAREREADARAAEATRRQAAAQAAEARAHEALARATDDAAQIRREAHAEGRTILREARQQAGQALDRLRADDVTRREAQETYHRLRRAETGLAPPAAEPLERAAGADPDAVTLRGLGLRGRIVAEAADGVTVQAGRLTVRVPREALEPAAASAVPRPTPVVSVPTRTEVPRELRLLGARTDEARGAVEKFLDEAVLAGHDAVRLVHGKGTGALRRAVADCLRSHPLVSSFRPAEAAAGGTGVTVVELVEAPRP